MLAEDFLRLADGFHTLRLMLGDFHRGTEKFARLQLGREFHSQLGHAHFLAERNGVIRAERASGLGRNACESVEVLGLVAPVGESGDALVLGESLACGEESVEREGELFGFHVVSYLSPHLVLVRAGNKPCVVPCLLHH